MKESLLKLAKLLAEDEKFLKEFSLKKSVDEQYDFAQKSVQGYTKEEFINFLNELEKSYELKGDLSPEDLEQVSGGVNAKTKAAAMAMLALSAISGAVPMFTSAVQTVARGNGVYVNLYEEDATAEIDTYLDDRELSSFGEAYMWRDTGDKTQNIRSKIKSWAQNIETKYEMLNKIRDTYGIEKNLGINWVYLKDKDGWQMEDSEKVRENIESTTNKLDESYKNSLKQYLKMFNEGYYLKELASGVVIFEKDERSAFLPNASKEFEDMIKQRLRRAKVFSKALKDNGMETEGQWIVRDKDTEPQPAANVQGEQIKIKYLNKDATDLGFLNYENCRDTGEKRREINTMVDAIKKDAVEKINFIGNLIEFINSSDFRWIKHKSSRLGLSWTGWGFNIKPEKMANLQDQATRGDISSKVILWLQEMFNAEDPYYLYFNGKEWGLTTNKTFTGFDDMFVQFGQFQKDNGYATKEEEYVTKEDYDDVLKLLIQEANLHRALSGALAANGMTVEANAVMIG